MIYTITEVSKILSISTSTLRRYDAKKHLVADEKLPTGHRRYSKEQIDEYIKSLRK